MVKPLLAFVKQHVGHSRLEPIASDAGNRRYYRLIDCLSPKLLLMDARDEPQSFGAFIRIAKALKKRQIPAPVVHYCDDERSLALIDDLGDQTLTRLLQSRENECALYRQSTDALITLQQAFEKQPMRLPRYDPRRLWNEARQLIDWYCSHHLDMALPQHAVRDFKQSWMKAFASLSPLPATFVARDFHVDNLILGPHQRFYLLDFQDAVWGSPCYDLMSLLEDARRDIHETTRALMLQHYLNKRPKFNQADFMYHYYVLACQRHCKVLGIFVRLSKRDKKHGYLAHLQRVEHRLRICLRQLMRPDHATSDLVQWFQRWLGW